MTEIPKAYEPQAVEAKWYAFWEQHGCFTADPARVSATRPAYSIVIPPPNVTGVLTLGHVLNNTIQDILARKARMDGKEVLWLPGTDHAGIATQNVVEKTLKKEGVIRHRDDLGREAMVAKIWDWKEKYGGIILKQLRALGASCDWTRTRFTMDPEYSRCVQKVFVDLYRKGLIYRGKRMVNWCPASLTALSDEEVVMKEQKGLMYHFRVEVVEPVGASSPRPSPPSNGGEGARRAGEEESRVGGPITDAEGRTWLTIATTRPETIPADTAVAVNPKDPRYTHLIGKHVYRTLPLDVPKEQRIIPIIADEHVAFDFGTGVLKVTPAHDKADFEIGLRHKLPVIDILTPDGKMTAEAGADLAGLDRFVARKKAAEILEAAGALEKAEPYVNNVGFSERADVPIEPRLSEQWFLKYPSVEAARACVAQPEASEGRVTRASDLRTTAADGQGLAELAPPSDQMRFHPDRWAKVYDHWMGGIQDWCISRQLWWGHRIPVWSAQLSTTEGNIWDAIAAAWRECERTNPGQIGRETSVLSIDGDALVLCLDLIKEKQASALDIQADFQVALCTSWDVFGEIAGGFLPAVRYGDVLDTWFSSWLWPFATMGWTGDKETDAKNPTLKAFYPTTDLVTGPDIIFFWVARMIMAGHEYMGDLPFRNVYFTGIIRDKQGRKMSKSLGNSPDPLDLIAKYGADALRFGVMRAAPLGQDVLFDEQAVELGRNFCNKLWNACRFRQMQGGETEAELDPARLTSDDKWILLRLDRVIREVTAAFAEYRFSDATAALYRFFWSEFCDWYLECSKAALGSPDHARKQARLAVLDFVLGHTLRLFHPFLPFITEELWHGLGYSADLPPDQGGRTIMSARWPQPLDADFKDFYGLDDCYEEAVEAKFELVRQGRNLRRLFNLPSAQKLDFILRPAEGVSPHEAEYLKLLLNAGTLTVHPDAAPPQGTPQASNAVGTLYLPLAGLVDPAAERARLGKELEKIRAEVAKVQEKLANPSFTQKVPPAVLAEHRQRLADWQAKAAQVEEALKSLEG